MMRKANAIRLAALAMALGGLWTAYSLPQRQADLQIEKVADSLHVIVGGGGNVGVLITDDGVVLVDDKFERHVPEILAKVKALTAQPVRYVLNTHHHGDHTGGNPPLAKSAEIIAHRNARRNMEKNSQPGLPKITFDSEPSLFLGGKEVRARYFGRGHTDGDAVIYFPALKVVHMGDLYLTGSPFIDYAAGGSAVEWDQTLEAALKLDFETVIPGHGAVTTREGLVEWRKKFATLRNRVGDLRHRGKSVEEAETLLKFDGLAPLSMDGRLKRSLPGLYKELGG